MTITIDGLGTADPLRRSAEARILRATRGLRAKPTSAHVTFTDENGPKGGADKRCAMTVEVPRRPAVHVEALAEAQTLAFTAAATALERELQQAGERARTTTRRPKKYFVARQLMTPEVDADRPLPVSARQRPSRRPGRGSPGPGRPLMRVKDVMVGDVVTIDLGATLLDAARRMRDANVGMLPVTDGTQLRGVITDRDLVVRAMARGVEPDAIPVAECLTRDVICAHPDWTVDRAMAEMARAKVGRLPVVDDHACVVGVVTLSSLALRSPDKEEALEAAQEVSRRSARGQSAA